MSFKEMTMYTVCCDGCGESVDEGTDYAGWGDKDSAMEIALGSDWHKMDDGSIYCGNCVEVDDDTDEYKPKLKVVK